MYIHLINIKDLNPEVYKIVITNDDVDTVKKIHEIFYKINDIKTFDVNENIVSHFELIKNLFEKYSHNFYYFYNLDKFSNFLEKLNDTSVVLNDIITNEHSLSNRFNFNSEENNSLYDLFNYFLSKSEIISISESNINNIQSYLENPDNYNVFLDKDKKLHFEISYPDSDTESDSDSNSELDFEYNICFDGNNNICIADTKRINDFIIIKEYQKKSTNIEDIIPHKDEFLKFHSDAILALDLPKVQTIRDEVWMEKNDDNYMIKAYNAHDNMTTNEVMPYESENTFGTITMLTNNEQNDNLDDLDDKEEHKNESIVLFIEIEIFDKNIIIYDDKNIEMIKNCNYLGEIKIISEYILTEPECFKKILKIKLEQIDNKITLESFEKIIKDIEILLSDNDKTLLEDLSIKNIVRKIDLETMNEIVKQYLLSECIKKKGSKIYSKDLYGNFCDYILWKNPSFNIHFNKNNFTPIVKKLGYKTKRDKNGIYWVDVEFKFIKNLKYHSNKLSFLKF